MFALKLCGAFLVFFAFALGGYSKSLLISCKANTLHMMIEFLNEILNNIHFKKTNVCNLLCEISGQQKYNQLKLNFNLCKASNWKENRDEALKASATHHSKYLSQQDFKIFANAIKEIGTNSAEEDEKQIEYYISQLESIYQTITQDLFQKKKLYLGVGVFSGAAIAIILL